MNSPLRLLIVTQALLQACVPPAGEAAKNAGDQRCADLAHLQLANATITGAEQYTDGRFANPNPGPYDDATLADLPAFCRVVGTASPVSGSRIGFEAWLPASGWNERLLMIGNGGYSSSIAYAALADYLRQGYAVAATDTGHDGDDPSFAVGRPESVVDWGYRAVHVAREQAHSVASSYFSQPPEFAYFAGCSTGGHQALMAAQRFPSDFDGILAGAPGHNRTHLNAGFLWQFVVNHRPDGGAEVILPASKLSLVNQAAIAQCRANNGSRSGGLPTDSYLDDPLACDFDVRTLLCEPEMDSGGCLTEQQAGIVEAIYDGPRNPRTGDRIYFGLTPGSETAGGPPGLPGWSLYWADPRNPANPARASFWRYWVFDDTDWDWWNFDFDTDMRNADRKLATTINAMDPDLSAFRLAGGKLLHYHGLNDPVVPATDSISYYSRVSAAIEDTAGFYRLFLAPGVEHCRGGPGADSAELLPALQAWVERGDAPERIVATKFAGGDPNGEVEFTRPLCPYPAYAIYAGSGDPGKSPNFECRTDIARPEIPEIAPVYLK